MPVANGELIRAINQFNILNTIRTFEAISRIEIAEITGQSRASVTNITAKLIEEGLILEKETVDTSSRGRRRILLALNPDAAYVAGVKVSAFRISCAVTDLKADIKSSIIVPVRTSERSTEYLADLIEDIVRHSADEARVRINKLSGIGIGIPGFVDTCSGVCYWTPLFKKGKSSLKDLIQERLKIDTYIENDSNTVTLAHQWFGEGKSIDNFIVVTIEDGIGMGIVSNGQIYRGTHGIAAEFGHVVVEPGGRLCRCGKKGCIEAYVSNFSILKATQDAIKAGKWESPSDQDLKMDDIWAAASNNEAALVDIFNKAGTILGMGLAGIVQIFNPNKIIISGEGVRAGSHLFDPMYETIDSLTNKELHDSIRIVIQKWRDTDWARGAASLVLQELYKSPVNRIKPVI